MKAIKRNLTSFFLGIFLMIGVGVTLGSGPGISQTNNNFYHSGVITYTAASQTVATTKMRTMVCDAWLFRNRSATETAYLNLNIERGYNGPALVSDVNMYDIPPGEHIELEDADIERFSVIGSGSGDLKWMCACK